MLKKSVFVVALVLLAAVGAFAQAPNYFAFEIGAGGGFEVDAGTVTSTNNVGIFYTFNEAFAGGFSFTDIGANNVTMVTIAVTPVENLYVRMHTGQIGTDLGFGAGFGYDVLARQEGFFTALGLYFDWYASNGGTYDIADGGVLTFGLKTKIGV